MTLNVSISTQHEQFRKYFAENPEGLWKKEPITPGSFGIALASGATPGRTEPRDGAEQDAQITFGTPYEVIAVGDGVNSWGVPHWIQVRLAQRWMGVENDVEVWFEGHRHFAIPSELFQALTNDSSLSVPVNTLTHIRHENDAACNQPVAVHIGCRLPLFENGRCLGPGGIFQVCSLPITPVPEIGQLPHTVEMLEKLVRSRSILGASYLWGGDGLQLDCSGFTKSVFQSFGVRLPRNSGQQATQGEAVAGLEEMLPGDLIFWGLPDGRITHVAIALEAGRNALVAHARQRVRIERLSENGVPDSVERNRVVKAIRRVVGFGR